MALTEVKPKDMKDHMGCSMLKQYHCDGCPDEGTISIYQGRWHPDEFGVDVKVRCSEGGEDQTCPVLAEAMNKYTELARKHQQDPDAAAA